MAKYKVWNATIDQGDGSSSVRQFPSKQALIEGLKLSEDPNEIYDGAVVFDKYGSPIEISEDTFNTEGYEEVE